MMSIIANAQEKTQLKFQDDLEEVIDRLRKMLVTKNVKYGDAALNPNQTFSTASPIELIKVRIDDKLSRIKNRQNNEDEDPAWDLLGYLVLLQIAEDRQKAVKDAQMKMDNLAKMCQAPAPFIPMAAPSMPATKRDDNLPLRPNSPREVR
jgi:hypothetical protein